MAPKASQNLHAALVKAKGKMSHKPKGSAENNNAIRENAENIKHLQKLARRAARKAKWATKWAHLKQHSKEATIATLKLLCFLTESTCAKLELDAESAY
ncbi:hypothetical protein VMCG_03717 [Cytospora schulzeri]|uniref:Uncharacterized protein n=1 Tax=Cytospora schulzeri TaxID=448051 RepID=A0A423WVA8_9PEZI|nr:hypothetical protein VMCG_03717 [Valsa malicola]